MSKCVKMSRYDANRDILAVENEALQSQLQEAATQMDNALQHINDRDQQIAYLKAGNQINDSVNVESILKDLQTPQVLRDF